MSLRFMEYRDFEAALAALHHIHEDDLKAFRARLRTLRGVRVPEVDQPGKGSRLSFSFDHLWETHLGLEFVNFGLPPLRVGALLALARVEAWLKRAPLKADEDCWALVWMNAPGALVPEPADLSETADSVPMLGATLGNIPRLQQELSAMQKDDFASVRMLIDLSQVTRDCNRVCPC